MGLETGTFISNLVATNPLSNDPRAQGDDHIRLLKSVLQATFPGASKAFPFPRTLSQKTTDYTVLSTDMNAVIPVSTSSNAVVLTLPTLASGDAGWNVTVVKLNSGLNPIRIVPPSGNINGFAGIRRTVQFVPFVVFWTGSEYVATRQHGLPIGAALEYYSSSNAPAGTLTADGSSFLAADWVELNVLLSGTTLPDRRGRAAYGLDGSANRLTSAGSGIDGDTLQAAGGSQTATILQANLPSFNLSHTLALSGFSHTHIVKRHDNLVTAQSGFGVSDLWSGEENVASDVPSIGTPTITGNVASGGSGTALVIMPPAIVANVVIVGE